MLKNRTFSYDIYDAILSLENVVINKYGVKEEIIEPIYKYFSKFLCAFYRSYGSIDTKSKEIIKILYSVSLYIFNLKVENVTSEKMYEVLVHATSYEIRNMIDNEELYFAGIIDGFYSSLNNNEKEIYRFEKSYKLSGVDNELAYEYTKTLILKKLHLTTSEYQINTLLLKKKEIDYGIVDDFIDEEYEFKLDSYIKELVRSSMPIKKRIK